MKKILFILLLLPFISKAQVYQIMPQYGYQMQRARMDSALLIPQDTIRNKTGIARIGTNGYIGNGTYWTQLAGGGGTPTLQQVTTAGDTTNQSVKFKYNSINRVSINPNDNWPLRISGLNNGDSTIIDAGDLVTYRGFSYSISRIILSPQNSFGTVALSMLQVPITEFGNTVNVQRIIPISVNGQFADTMGNITLNSTATLQQVLDNNHDLVNGINLQGTGSGSGNSGANINSFGGSALENNIGNDVNAFGNSSGRNNNGSDVNAMGNGSANGNNGFNVNAFGYEAGINNVYGNVNLFGRGASATDSNQTSLAGSTYQARIDYNRLSDNQKYDLPDSSGTIALLSNITGADSTIFYTKFRSDTSRANIYTSLANKVETGSNGSLQSLTITGTNGAGHIHLRHQASLPTATGQSSVIYANSDGNFAWKNDGNYHTTLKTNLNNADRVYTFQNKSYTVADSATVVAKQDTGLSWNKSGNNNITASNFLGSTNNASLRIATNNIQRMVVDSIGSVSIGNGSTAAVASALLDMTSTTRGLLIPRMTTTQRDAIATPATGLQVYNTTTNANDYYNGSAWVGGLTNGTQTIAGAKTFSSLVTFSNNTNGFNYTFTQFLQNSAVSLTSFNAIVGLSGATAPTSGIKRLYLDSAVFNPSSGNASFANFESKNTINQTGGASGITRGFYINDIITAAADYRALEIATGKIVYSATNTAAGTTGAQTINKISGKVNAAAGSTSLVVTNNLVTAASIVMCELGTNDATARITNVVEGAGSFTINYVAPTGETVIKFWVIN